MLRLQEFLSTFMVLALTLSAHAQHAKSSPKTVRLRRGQTLSLSLLTPIDSGHAHLGDDVALKLVRPLVADGRTVLPAKWIVHGRVTKVKRAGNNCHEGQVVWKLDHIKTPGCDRLKLQRIDSYPLKYAGSGDPIWVPLDSPLMKIGGAAKFIGLLAASIALSPLLVPLAIATTERCEDQARKEKSLPLGLGNLYAVSKTVAVAPIP